MDVLQMIEDVKSIRNECDIILTLHFQIPQEAEIKHLYPTILENIATKAQDLIDSYCIVGKNG